MRDCKGVLEGRFYKLDGKVDGSGMGEREAGYSYEVGRKEGRVDEGLLWGSGRRGVCGLGEVDGGKGEDWG